MEASRCGVQRSIDAKVAQSAEEVSTAAQRLFQAIRDADYSKDWSKPKDWRQFPAKDVNYDVRRGYPGWVQWVCNKFKADPIVDVNLARFLPTRKAVRPSTSALR